MPIPGQGAVPTGSLYTELTSTTRRAFVPRLFVQIYYSTPSLFHLMGGAQKSAGGLSQITIPIQGQSMVQGQFTGASGGFNSPVATPGIQNAQFSTCYWVVPVPLPFGETVLQATDREISILKARMNDVWSVTVQNIGSLLFSNNSANSLLPNSFFDAFDNGINAPVYGGINRNAPGNASWKGQYYTAGGGAGQSGNIGFTRKTMSNSLIIMSDAAGGEAPGYVIMNPADFATLNTDFVGSENIYIPPNREYTMASPVRSSFPNLNVAGVPIFADHFCPLGSAFYVNPKYTSMYMSEDAAFDFCVPGSTMIALADGSQKAMCDMREGDRVVTYANGRRDQNVLEFLPQKVDEIFEIRAGGKTVRANARHPFLVRKPEGDKWTRLKYLVPGDHLFLMDGAGEFYNSPIESVSPVGREMVFDIHVENDHNFVADGILAHNSGFYSLVPLGQIGQQGVVVLGYNVCTAKPVANATVVGIANPSTTF